MNCNNYKKSTATLSFIHCFVVQKNNRDLYECFKYISFLASVVGLESCSGQGVALSGGGVIDRRQRVLVTCSSNDSVERGPLIPVIGTIPVNEHSSPSPTVSSRNFN